MNWQEYTALALRTESPYTHRGTGLSIRLAHAIDGLACEALEFNFEASAEELGDLYWYTALGLDELAGWSALPHRSTSMFKIIEHLASAKKAHLYYGKHFSYVEAKEYFLQLEKELNGLCADLYSGIDILSLNIQKLKIRYPEKYDSSHAINRNLTAEQGIFKGNI